MSKGNGGGKQVQGHRWVTPNIKSTAGKFLTYCVGCGLVYLKNEATDKAVRAGCRK